MTKLVVERKALLDAIAAVMPAVASLGGALPTLRGIKITALEVGPFLSAANLALYLDATLEAKVDGPDPAEVVVNARKLRTVVSRGLPAGPITIDLDPKRPSLSAGSATVWLDALELDAWPKRRPITNGAVVALTAADVAVIKRVSVAASDDWARPILHSVCLADGYATGTDSYRLIAGRISTTPARPVLLPLEVVKVLPAAGVDLVVEQLEPAPTPPQGERGRHYGYTAGAVSWPGGYARLVAGDYPRWSGLMPEPNPVPLVLDRAAFLAAVLRAEAVLADTDYATPLRLVPAAGGIALGARGPDGNELLRDGVELFEPRTTAEPVAVNARFLVELLRSIEGDRVRLSIRDSLHPFLLTADTDDVEAFRALQMPVRVDPGSLKAAA